MIAKICIQCTDKNGNVGHFLLNNSTREQITPTFYNFVQLLDYCNIHFPDRQDIGLKCYEIKTIL